LQVVGAGLCATKAWSNVELMCATLIKHAPPDSFTILHAAEAQHQQGHSGEAFLALKRGENSFNGGGNVQYFYALARYACAINSVTVACSVLGMAIDIDSSIKMKALNDPDLKRAWTDLQDY
jgi:hypothetical protein